ncbi:hypothetical protein NW765_016160 [Fusarium oxysporum]|nr:hypothetical protein NW765_016160 [Fusarium oxysporum]
MIEEEFGFTAQARQYQSRITKWGKDKNIKKVEMTAIVRKHQQREILEPGKRKLCFTVRGREVEADKIDRWMDRNNVPRNDLYAPSPAASTPSAVNCRTISERGSLAHSPALSEMNLAFSSGGITPVAQSPTASSPALRTRDNSRPRQYFHWAESGSFLFSSSSTTFGFLSISYKPCSFTFKFYISPPAVSLQTS